MPKISYETHGFASDASGTLTAGRAALSWAAVTVGGALGMPYRPTLEMVWRAAMVKSALTVEDGFWRMSPAYARLDPTEKGAVSYFLGMTMAKLTTKDLLGIHHLVHLDTFLEQGHLPRRGRRPDFLGLDRRHEVIATVESKGRSDILKANAITAAKLQARNIPTPLGLPALSVASLAWFDGSGRWRSTLVDPPEEHPILDGTSEGLLRSYYEPILAAAIRTGTWERRGDIAMFTLPEVNMVVVVSSAIVDAVQEGYSMIEAVDDASRFELSYEGDSNTEVFSGPDSIAVLDGEAAFERSDFIRWTPRAEEDLG